MPFRWLFYAHRISILLAIMSIAMVVAATVVDRAGIKVPAAILPVNELIGAAGVIAFALALIICLATIAAVVCVQWKLGSFYLGCPFCRRSGPAWSGVDGLRMLCPECGLIHAAGKWIPRLICESASDDAVGEKALEDMPARQRPRSLPLFPDGWKYFRHWRSLRWYLALLVLPAVGVLGSWWQGRPDVGIACFPFAGFAACILFVQVYLGVSSSNWGTYFRSQEPWRFWGDAGLLAAAYVLLSVVPWFA